MIGKCDKKVNTSFVITFSLPKGEKNVMTSQNVEVAEAYRTLPNFSLCHILRSDFKVL